MSKKIPYNHKMNMNQTRLGDENKSKRDLCAVTDCDRDKCPCQYFRMRF